MSHLVRVPCRRPLPQSLLPGWQNVPEQNWRLCTSPRCCSYDLRDLEQSLELASSLRMEIRFPLPYDFLGLLRGLNEQVHSAEKTRLDTSPRNSRAQARLCCLINIPGM